MRQFWIPVSVLLAVVLALGQGSKIDRSLQASLAAKASANVFVQLKEGTKAAIASARAALKPSSSHAERTTTVYNALLKSAQVSQKEVLGLLESRFPSLKVRSFWINNQIYVQDAPASVVQSLAELDQVSRIQEEELTHISKFLLSRGESVRGRRNGVLADWGHEKMRVPEIWAMDGGNSGEGLVIGNIDTGVRGSHELLRAKWVGLENNGWLDPEENSDFPNDVYNHGTHTMGSLVGSDGIGAAPNATWLACKGYRDNGSGATSTFLACGEYMLCPVDYLGNNPDCSKAPQVVSNSWGFLDGELFDPLLEAWLAAGILSSFSAGNLYSCDSLYSPSDRPGALCVGATEKSDELAYFSSKGPSTLGEVKPEISAPGVDIYSASAAADDAYMTASGTSMSCPLTTGVLALLKRFDPNLNQVRAEEVLKQTAEQGVPSGETCGGIPDNQYPNNHIGYGRIDGFAAVQLLKKANLK